MGSEASGWRLACWICWIRCRMGMGGLAEGEEVVMVVVVVGMEMLSCKDWCSHRTSSPAVSLCWRTRRVRVRRLRTASQASKAPMTLPRCTRCPFKPAIQSFPVPVSLALSLLLPSSSGPSLWSTGRQANTPHSKSPCPPRYLVPL